MAFLVRESQNSRDSLRKLFWRILPDLLEKSEETFRGHPSSSRDTSLTNLNQESVTTSSDHQRNRRGCYWFWRVPEILWRFWRILPDLEECLGFSPSFFWELFKKHPLGFSEETSARVLWENSQRYLNSEEFSIVKHSSRSRRIRQSCQKFSLENLFCLEEFVRVKNRSFSQKPLF